MKLRGVMRVRSLWRVSLVGAVFLTMVSLGGVAEAVPRGCLLYTSDAADE